MKRLMFAALAAAAFAAPALADDTIADLRQPAIDKCVAAGTGGDPAQSTQLCTCLIDGIISKIPGDDGAKMLKLVIADPKSEDDAAAALGITVADAKAFVASHQQAVSEAATACLPQQ